MSVEIDLEVIKMDIFSVIEDWLEKYRDFFRYPNITRYLKKLKANQIIDFQIKCPKCLNLVSCGILPGGYKIELKWVFRCGKCFHVFSVSDSKYIYLEKIIKKIRGLK